MALVRLFIPPPRQFSTFVEREQKTRPGKGVSIKSSEWKMEWNGEHTQLQLSLVPRPFPPPVLVSSPDQKWSMRSKTGGGNGLGTRLVAALLCDWRCQERMMTSFLLRREEEERVTAKNSKQAESPACTENRTHLPTSSQFHDLRPHNAVLPS